LLLKGGELVLEIGKFAAEGGNFVFEAGVRSRAAAVAGGSGVGGSAEDGCKGVSWMSPERRWA